MIPAGILDYHSLPEKISVKLKYVCSSKFSNFTTRERLLFLLFWNPTPTHSLMNIKDGDAR